MQALRLILIFNFLQARMDHPLHALRVLPPPYYVAALKTEDSRLKSYLIFNLL